MVELNALALKSPMLNKAERQENIRKKNMKSKQNSSKSKVYP